MKKALTTLLLGWFARLRFPTLLTITGVLFVVNLFMPDLVPFVDEILLGLVTLILANWKKRDGEIPGPANQNAARAPIDVESIDVTPRRGERGTASERRDV
jgi:hypothetical protein